MSSENHSLSNVRNVVLVLSGKGGVGKSTTSVQLALSLIALGKKVGILDVDICGPSIPHMLGLGSNEREVYQSDQGWVPVYAKAGGAGGDSMKLSVMSIAFLIKSDNDAVIWRGPKKHAMIKQFVEDVCWGDLDFLIIDTPPGTSDEHMSIMESLRAFTARQGSGKVGGILVTTPNLVSVGDVRREVTFCQKTGLNVIGVVENMSGGVVCPNCQECTNIFPTTTHNGRNVTGGEILCEESGLDFLGRVPIDPNLVKCGESGENFIEKFETSPAAIAVNSIRDQVINKLMNSPAKEQTPMET